MATTRIIYMGTPEFAVPGVQRLVESGDEHGWQVVGVVTQPDRRAGRGKKMAASPVKRLAESYNISLLQPASLRKQPDMVEALAAWAPDLFVVAAYGLILPSAVLTIPQFGSINVHASILPAYRGASPITAALLDGLDTTGVSIMLMDEGMDTGPVLAQAALSVAADDTAATLSARLAELGAQCLVETLPGWLAGDVAPIAQEELPGEVTLCRLIKKQDGRIDWTSSARQIERMTRAYAPWPGAYTIWKGERFKIHRAEPRDGVAEPGQIVALEGAVAVGAGNGLLVLHEVQPAGKRVMDIRSFLNGAPDFLGSTLGDFE